MKREAVAEENTDKEVEKEEKDEIVEEYVELDLNPFDSLKASYLKGLQDVIIELGLNTESGIGELLSSTDNKDVIQRLMENLNIAEDEAKAFIEEWRKAHKEVELQKKKAKKKFRGLEAIWHCAVCGRGGLPQPICFVAPYVSSYRPIPM